ncbi:MAG: aminopeptidase P family protein [Bacteroidales bacterium]|nr:aminopeptidase P family protein [Bacteroidales bacterium]
MENIYAQRVEAVRRLMADNNWDAVVFTSSDPHGSEYLAPRWQSVTWISGFTGEAADLVITRDHAGLWTDSRYFIQANAQLAGSGIELHKTRRPDSVYIPEWLASRARVIALDGKSVSVSFIWEIENAFPNYIEPQIVDVPDLIDLVRLDRPEIPDSPVVTLNEAEIGESRRSKLSWLRERIAEHGCDSMIVTALDEIAWLLNIRGSDIDYNPYVISYLYVSAERVIWFARKSALSEENEDSYEELQADGIEVQLYDDIDGFAASLADEGDRRVLVDDATLNYSLWSTLTGALGLDGVVTDTSPVPLRKAQKTAREIECMRDAHLEDGVAMEKFLYWLENRVKSGERVDEWEASLKLTSLRSEIIGYFGDSFENISAYGPGAALPHYSTPSEGSAVIEPHGLYLTDSGGQYFYGTTDITRTVPMGECTPLEMEDYTLCLKGMIQLAMAEFPRGTAGCQVDVLARNALWRSKRDFGHGTGHGIGFFLGVHEGPQDIRQNFNRQPLLPGMITSDEPGIYREGRHGVRHEILLLCVEDGRNDFGDWLSFEVLTLCHIDTSAIVRSLMLPEEIAWLNAYNATVCERLSPRLPAPVAAWLRTKTLPI